MASNSPTLLLIDIHLVLRLLQLVFALSLSLSLSLFLSFFLAISHPPANMTYSLALIGSHSSSLSPCIRLNSSDEPMLSACVQQTLSIFLSLSLSLSLLAFQFSTFVICLHWREEVNGKRRRKSASFAVLRLKLLLSKQSVSRWRWLFLIASLGWWLKSNRPVSQHHYIGADRPQTLSTTTTTTTGHAHIQTHIHDRRQTNRQTDKQTNTDCHCPAPAVVPVCGLSAVCWPVATDCISTTTGLIAITVLRH